MTQPVTLPLWAFILILLFAVVTFASNFLFPSVRWFFRKRAERLVAQLNTRLQRPIEPFKLAHRYDMIQRLLYDPAITKAIVDHAREHDVPENVAFEKAKNYAREIVPSFSATAYFTFGMRFARWLSRMLYRVRLGSFDREALESLDKDATVIFVMNHRSNMDYVLVTYLVSRASALSYAVGEWARVWPLSGMIKMLGGYFIRRKSRRQDASGGLYRKVLARYVQMATSGGVTQAVFPEGGLSLTGAMAKPRLGILSYVIDDFDPEGRDVVFVPVAINYDRVLEDRFLIKADESGVRRFRPPLFTVLGGVAGYLWARVRGKMTTFGTANVSFGQPLSLRTYASDHEGTTADVGHELMTRIAGVIPLLPVPLVSHALLAGAKDEAAITIHITDLLGRMPDTVRKPRRAPDKITQDGLTILRRREIIKGDAEIAVVEGEESVLRYYANSIAHHIPKG